MQRETENLLSTINGPKKPSGKTKNTIDKATKQLQKIVKVTKSKRDGTNAKKQNAMSQSLDLEKTHKLYGANTPARVTVEVRFFIL